MYEQTKEKYLTYKKYQLAQKTWSNINKYNIDEISNLIYNLYKNINENNVITSGASNEEKVQETQNRFADLGVFMFDSGSIKVLTQRNNKVYEGMKLKENPLIITEKQCEESFAVKTDEPLIETKLRTIYCSNKIIKMCIAQIANIVNINSNKNENTLETKDKILKIRNYNIILDTLHKTKIIECNEDLQYSNMITKYGYFNLDNFLEVTNYQNKEKNNNEENFRNISDNNEDSLDNKEHSLDIKEHSLNDEENLMKNNEENLIKNNEENSYSKYNAENLYSKYNELLINTIKENTEEKFLKSFDYKEFSKYVTAKKLMGKLYEYKEIDIKDVFIEYDMIKNTKDENNVLIMENKLKNINEDNHYKKIEVILKGYNQPFSIGILSKTINNLKNKYGAIHQNNISQHRKKSILTTKLNYPIKSIVSTIYKQDSSEKTLQYLEYLEDIQNVEKYKQKIKITNINNRIIQINNKENQLEELKNNKLDLQNEVRIKNNEKNNTKEK